MLKIFKFDKEVYSGAEIRERVHYYSSEANRIFELSKVNIDSAMSEFKRLKDEIKAEYGYYDKMNFQTIVGSFIGNNAVIVNSYVELVSDIVSKLYNTNNKRYLTRNLGEFGLYISFSSVEEQLIDNVLYGHHQAVNVERDLRVVGSDSRKYAFLEAQRAGKTKRIFCAIGDEVVDGRPYAEIVKIAEEFVKHLGGFEALAEWGLI